MSTKTLDLVNALFAGKSKVFDERPPELSKEQIATEIKLREETDQLLQGARMRVIRQLFHPETTSKPNPFK